MNLSQNPFYILQASPRDNRQRIMELADERSLLADPETCSQARLVLTTPRKRLATEIAWLPGIGPKRAGEMLALVKSLPAKLFTIHNLPPLTRINLLAAALSRIFDGNISNRTLGDTAIWVLHLAREFEIIDPNNLRTLINEERNVAGFPPVLDLQDIEAVLQEQRQYYRQVIWSALNTFPFEKQVKAVTMIVDSATDNGKKPNLALIADLVDWYEIETQTSLEEKEENISHLVKKLRDTADAKAADATLLPIVEQLINAVKNWDTVAQPIQVSMKGQGLNHDASHRVARLVRDLSVHLFNEHNKLDFSRQLTDMLQEAFAEVSEIADLVAEDTQTLQKLDEQQKQFNKGCGFSPEPSITFNNEQQKQFNKGCGCALIILLLILFIFG